MEARVLVAIACHYVPARLVYLASVLRMLSEFQVSRLTVVIQTNTDQPDEVQTLRRLLNELLPSDETIVETCRGLRDPFELTWEHKRLIAQHFGGEAAALAYSHFIYLEDDMAISFANFLYFCTYRTVLQGHGLIPSFLRVEYQQETQGYTNTDMSFQTTLSAHSSISVDGYAFVTPPNPYCASFILDCELAREHIDSASFDVDRSLTVCSWPVRERAAMALCFVQVSPMFGCRYVVPVSTAYHSVPTFAWLSHVANNYADDRETPFGKVRMDSLFL